MFERISAEELQRRTADEADRGSFTVVVDRCLSLI